MKIDERIAALEARIAQLEARLARVEANPVHTIGPSVPYTFPAPTLPPPQYPTITCTTMDAKLTEKQAQELSDSFARRMKAQVRV